MAATTALESEFPFVKVITPEHYIGFSEQVRWGAKTGFVAAARVQAATPLWCFWLLEE
jgi:hypothetical protein